MTNCWLSNNPGTAMPWWRAFLPWQIDALAPVSYQPIETESLGAWTTNHALSGLFYLVGEQEKAHPPRPLRVHPGAGLGHLQNPRRGVRRDHEDAGLSDQAPSRNTTSSSNATDSVTAKTST